MRLSVAGLALVVACTAAPAPTTTESKAPPNTTAAPTTTQAPTTTTTARPVLDPDFTIRIGVNSMPSFFDPVLSELAIVDWPPYGIPQQPSLYRLAPPTSTLIPLLAADPEPPLGQASDDGWEIIVPLRPWITWDDGTPVDADDVAFSFDVFQTTASWGFPVLHTVEAVDDFTVRMVWEARPTVDMWQLGVALAPIVSADLWRAQPERPEPGSEIPGLDPTTIPTTGPYRLTEVATDGWTLEAVPDWWEAGSTFTVWNNGAVRYRNPIVGLDETYGQPNGDPVAEWTTGPYASRVEYQVFEDLRALSVPLMDGDIDLMLSRMQFTGRLQSSLGLPDHIGFSRSPRSRLYWVAFNTRRRPFDDLAARRAATCSFDPQFLAENVLAGVAGAAAWGTGLGPWQDNEAPRCDGEEDPQTLEGELLQALAPGPGYDPLAATAGLWVENWLSKLGADLIAHTGLSPEQMASKLTDPEAWYVAIMTAEIDPARLTIEPTQISEVTGWQPPGTHLLTELTRNAYTLGAAQEATRRLQQLWAQDVPAVSLFHDTFLEFFNPTTISPPFLTRDGDRFTTPLLNGLQAWEAWIIPATRPADG